jgi:hypothetical protein
MKKKPKKPLPEPPVQDDGKKHRLTKHAKKKKRRSVMESTKRSEDDVGKFIKIGNKPKKQLRRVSSANIKLEEGVQANFPYHTSTDLLENASVESLGLGNNSPQNFVKRMTSFNWRIKSKNKTVQV